MIEAHRPAVGAGQLGREPAGLADDDEPARAAHIDGLSHEAKPAGETIAEPAPDQSRN
jgi:hypothetical protein